MRRKEADRVGRKRTDHEQLEYTRIPDLPGKALLEVSASLLMRTPLVPPLRHSNIHCPKRALSVRAIGEEKLACDESRLDKYDLLVLDTRYRSRDSGKHPRSRSEMITVVEVQMLTMQMPLGNAPRLPTGVRSEYRLRRMPSVLPHILLRL